ncbi:MAG: cobalamin biosynthesis protein, partial [Cyanobium sp.]
PDPSPNAGVSQAAFAHAVGVRLGGVNRYAGVERAKPILAAQGRPPRLEDVERFLALSRRLQVLWLLVAGVLLVALASMLRR